jgi:hypothetical protein
VNDFGGHLFFADREVLKAALRLRAPQALGRHFDCAHAVGFGAGLGHSGDPFRRDS